MNEQQIQRKRRIFSLRLRKTLALGAVLLITPAYAEFVGTGGEVTRDGEYLVHTFTNATDTFTVAGSGEVEVLLVGGGGGGGAYGGGGGGGGQVVSNRVTLTSRAYDIRVGAGGRGASATKATPTAINYQADAGGDTSAFGFTARGGGAGGSVCAGFSGANGGGGGVAAYKTTPASDITMAGGLPNDVELGFGGGASLQPAGQSHFLQAAGGGGGAGGAGADAAFGDGIIVAGRGGCGVTNAITGVALGYGGGGGGGRSQGTTGGATDGGGAGGTGSSEATVTGGAPGVDGHGGGGGGGGRAVRTPGNGGNGGCGVVIVRYKPIYPERFEQVEVAGNYSYRRKTIDGVKYGIYTFTNDVFVTLVGTSYADLLLVGGGGGGGGGRAGGGGGGAGGVIYREHITLTNGVYSVRVGTGGAGAVPNPNDGNKLVWPATNGCPTIAFGLKALGGGAGGSNGGAGKDGACGGGGSAVYSSEATVLGGKGMEDQGKDGGSATRGNAAARAWCGGGGGAYIAGANAEKNDVGDSGNAGAGGDGVPCRITGTEVRYGAGGGGGYGDYTSGNTKGTVPGGDDGGGAGSGRASPTTNDGLPGCDGLGGGGGGGGAANTSSITASGAGGKGGNGVVILRVHEEPRGMMLLFR